MKSRLADGSLVLNTAVFRGAYDDVQVGTFTSFDADGDGNDDSFFGSFGNAGNATIQGAEIEFDWTPTPLGWLGLAGHVSYLDATPDDFVDGNDYEKATSATVRLVACTRSYWRREANFLTS